MRIFDQLEHFTLRALRAWRFHRLLRYSWRLAWAKAGWQTGDLT